jgi:DNA ligase 1
VASFYEFAELCETLSQTSSRLQLAQAAGDFLARLEPAEAAIAARFLVGRALEQGGEKRLQISGRAVWRAVAELTGAADQADEIFAAARDFGEAIELTLRWRPLQPEATLALNEVHDRLRAIAAIEGANSRARKLALVADLFARASSLEGKYLAKILIGEMRHGVSEGLMLEAIARMANRSSVEIRLAHQLEPDLGRLIIQLRSPDRSAHESPQPDGLLNPAGESRPSEATLPLASRPLRPMLAAPASNVAEAFQILGPALALEHKLDGARVQIHCDHGQVRIYSRRLNEVTASLPEIVEAMARSAPRQAIFDGEVIAADREGKAVAFQDLMRRFGRTRDIEKLRAEQPVRLFVFDLVGLDTGLLIDHPYEARYDALREIAAASGLDLAARILPSSIDEGSTFYAQAIAAGYEGVMAKGLASLYTPGARGRGWLKIKAARTFDLVMAPRPSSRSARPSRD